MKSLLKFLGLAAIIVLAGLWIMTVSKSCNQNKIAGTTKLETAVTDKVTEVKDDAESLFEGETEEEGLFNEEGDEVAANTNEAEEEAEDDEGDDTDLENEIAARESTNKASTGSTSASNAAAINSDGMEYLVIGGAFLTEVNAKAEVNRLKKKGYENAEVITFDFSQYHSVCVQRTASLSEARATKAKLVKGGNPEAYVHKKRSYKK